MRISILIPHYKTGKMTCFSVAQLIKYKGKHELDITIIDNNAGDGSLGYLAPLSKEHTIRILNYPKGRLQSHGVAFDYAIDNGFVTTPYFLTLESDSFPVKDNFIDYYERLIESGIDAAGSLLKLSGGTYLHPCGALYRTEVYREAKSYVNTIEYNYYPNFMMRDNFAVHTMIHKSLVNEIEDNPSDWVELGNEYKDNPKQTMREKALYYSPVGCGVFHNGMGGRQESIRTYGNRTLESEIPFAILGNKNQKIIGRLGQEPGQFLSYYMGATGKKIFYIPTETKWLPEKENQQQDHTLNEAGIKHLWAISAYHNYTPESEKDIALFKQSIPDQLYETLPPHQKIKSI